MPTYEYACPKCGHTFEAFQSMKDEPLTKCPKCKKTGVKRLVGKGAGLIFKGSGFYITDYKKTSGAAASGGESKTTESKSETKSSATKSAESKSTPKGGDAKSSSTKSP